MVIRSYLAALIAATFVWSLPLRAEAQAFDSPVRDARKRLTEAQSEQKKAEAEFKAAVAKLRAEYQKGEEWIEAQAVLKHAQQDFEASREAVLKTLQKNPAYQKALAEKKKADAERERSREQNAPPEQMFEVASKAIIANTAVQKLEDAAVDADPKAGEAKKRITDATAIIEELEKQFEESVQSNADLETVRSNLAAAKERVTQANADLKESIRQQIEARRNR